MKTGVYLLLGSNLGDKAANLSNATERLQSVGSVSRRSSLYSTQAWGPIAQPAFFNQVILLATAVSPAALLDFILGCEKAMGRVRDQKWGQRLIDIDILFYGSQVVSTDRLVIPHPHIAYRRFTLVPLCEIAGDFVHPVSGKSVQDMLLACPDKLTVDRVESKA